MRKNEKITPQFLKKMGFKKEYNDEQDKTDYYYENHNGVILEPFLRKNSNEFLIEIKGFMITHPIKTKRELVNFVHLQEDLFRY